MPIEVVSRQRLVPVDARAVSELASAALDAVGRAGSSLTVAFVRDRRIKELNLTFRGKDRPTDVLSFAASDDEGEAGGGLATDYLFAPDYLFARDYLGDIVISTDTAARQAREAGHSVEREVSELVIHGVLHLCGYDHETDRGEMNRLEHKLRRRLLDRN